MNKCDIRVVTPPGRDRNELTETLRRLGYDIVNGTDPAADHDEIVVVDVRGSAPSEWAEIERDLGDSPAPTVVIADEHNTGFVALAQRLGRSVVFASGESAVGYGVAVKLCALMIEDRHAQVAA